MKNIFAVSIAALFAVSVLASPTAEPRQSCIAEGNSCNRLGAVGKKCCTFLVCDWDTARCKKNTPRVD
ncbi:unnamed protein product [Rhizoctonia solani]|uniref:Uncharacterized protein n=1 Tax=Rhizoctonia solani TaxID=456999 RepID=A0A8H3ATU4_9AGAM|nr:unnamed protein product [Rhizoctonia solani]